jgi:hypothetical protein
MAEVPQSSNASEYTVLLNLPFTLFTYSLNHVNPVQVATCPNGDAIADFPLQVQGLCRSCGDPLQPLLDWFYLTVHWKEG